MHSISFATPGHRCGRSCGSLLERVMSLRATQEFLKGSRLLQGAFQLDHSTSIGDLGSLFVWHGDKPVQQLKRHLADAYGAVWSFPSTHGTTILNILALLTACPAGGRVLINRDAHKSVTAAMIQGGLHPVYLIPEYDTELGLSLGPTLAGFREALKPRAGRLRVPDITQLLWDCRRARSHNRAGARARSSSRRGCRTCPSLPFLRSDAQGCRGSGCRSRDAVHAQSGERAGAGQPSARGEREIHRAAVRTRE